MKTFQMPRDRDRVEKFFRRTTTADRETEEAVRRIIDDVRRRGDRAVAALTRRLDGVTLKPADFFVSSERLEKAWNGLGDGLRQSLQTSHDRIREFHRRQMIEGFTLRDDAGIRMDQRVMPLARVGVYVPGGLAAYPSTVLMDVVPARVAGVDEVVVLTPPGRLDDPGGQAALGAAWLAGVDRVLAVGGTPGIAAIALGTETIPRVDMIVGPGNRYIAMAKKLLHGEIDIDMVAGPSEILIVADDTAPPELIAADMLSQAEHDPDAQAIAVLIGDYDVDSLKAEVRRQTRSAPRAETIRKSLRANGAIIRVESPEEAVALANRKAPEHLEIIARRARTLAGQVRNVGAIFLGRYTPEAVGDYVAGPNHTLPTGGTARFFSPLSATSFLKTSHVVECSRSGLEAVADAATTIADTEGFDAHAQAIRRRLG